MAILLLMDCVYPDLLDEPFIGIWENRKDMDDRLTWVRKTRHTEWRTF